MPAKEEQGDMEATTSPWKKATVLTAGQNINPGLHPLDSNGGLGSKKLS